MDQSLGPLNIFRFRVEFSDPNQSSVPLCSGLFSECSGLEATMEPKVVKQGGANYGANQLPGAVTFSTVILKRGLTTELHQWQWWDLVNRQYKYAYRLNAKITLLAPAASPRDHTAAAPEPLYANQIEWELLRALPIKFKSPDLNATSSDVGIEELHLAHEGLVVQPGTAT